MKRLIMYLLLITMLLLGLTGCSEEKTSEQESMEKESSEEVVTTEESAESNTVAQEAQQNEITFMYTEQEDGTLCVELYSTDTPPEVLEVPSEIDGKKVTAIKKLFYQESTIRKVILPETVTHIGKDSFTMATSIEELEIKGVIEEIGENAFFMCEKLKALTFKEGLIKIGECGIYGCPDLEEVHLPGSVEDISGKSNLVFCAEDFTVYAPAGSIFESYAKEVGIKFQAE